MTKPFDAALFNVDGKDEFVTTDYPDRYHVCMRLTPGDAAAVGHERVIVSIDVLGEVDGGSQFGVRQIYSVVGNDKGDGILTDPIQPHMAEVFGSERIGDDIGKRCAGFIQEVGGFENINRYYDEVLELEPRSGLEDMLRAMGLSL